ncbi:fucose 4-O-acetylase [Photobacterium aquae]|uniref:Fucose 4-O-acetylase n=1 Tax=Photobacterium aquae TaxID=1195763 RepID=A0A0J1JY80_9GAMM|nr:acyltransferase family protein [Photobacterium aquae]KLV07207.1 fucose 4-O-acetylase [Photobacterium aquae]
MNTNRITSFDAGRVIALFAVITIHCQLFKTAPLINGEPWVGLVLNQLSRFAVPLFFILAGYFIAPKLKDAPFPTLKKYGQPLLKVWLAWSVIYLVSPFNFDTLIKQGYFAERMGYWQYLLSQPLNTLFEGGMVHLWYIPGLLSGLFVIALCFKYKVPHTAIVAIAVIIYLYGLMGGSYTAVFHIDPPIFTRNGPFMSTLMLGIGIWLRINNTRCRLAVAATITLIGVLLHFGEAMFLLRFDMPFNEHDFLFGTPIWATGLFLMLLSRPQFGSFPALPYLSQQVLGVYLCHILIIIYLMNLLPMLGVSGYTNEIARWILACIISYGVVSLIDKTALKKLLLR